MMKRLSVVLAVALVAVVTINTAGQTPAQGLSTETLNAMQWRPLPTNTL